jgi:Zn-dependent protease with chaperone function
VSVEDAAPPAQSAASGLAARYFDGHSGRAQPAQLRLHEGQLEVQWDDGQRRDAPASLDFVASQGRAPMRIRFADGASCELANDAAAQALAAQLGRRPGRVERLEAHGPAVAALLGVFALLMAATYFWGIPWATDQLAARFPVSWERQLGSGVQSQLEAAGLFKDSQLPAERQDAIRRDFAGFTRPDARPSYNIEFRRMGVPNAFALPGGTIVVSDEIVALAGEDPDALRTVLAHELGHLQYRHGVRNLVHASLVSAWIAWYVGDVSALVASMGAGFAELHYSRSAEAQADRYAWALMHRHGRSTHGAAQLFRRLAEGDGAKKGGRSAEAGIPVYMSTHPAIAERIALFESDTPPRDP